MFVPKEPDVVVFFGGDASKTIASKPPTPAAVEEARRWAPELVITDLKMAPMGGLEVLEETQKLHPGVPVVVAGLAEGVEAGDPGRANHRGRTLFRALEGWGGGTYEAGGVVTVQLPASVDADHVTVRLALRLG